MSNGNREPRLAAVEDGEEVARLLHDFNTEYGVPSPGVPFLTERLRALLAGEGTFAVISGDPAFAVGLVTVRTNVWYSGHVGLLDELYVSPGRRGQGDGSAVIDLVLATCRARGVQLLEINVDEGDIEAQRFYHRHGFASGEPESGERSFYFHMELEA